MAEIPTSLSTLLLFAALLFALAWFNRTLATQIFTLIYRITGSEDAAIVGYFLIFLPGILIHEGSHWLMARLLGLKTSKFRVWPTRQGKSIGLGSVNVQSAGNVADSVVGMAPLIVGTLLIGVIGYHIFGADAIATALGRGQWRDGLDAFLAALGQQDGVLWAYLIFTIANVMMPSPSDREPLKPVLLYLALASAIYLVVGLPLDLLSSAVDWLTPAVEILSSALIFTVLLDLLIAMVLYALLFVVRR